MIPRLGRKGVTGNIGEAICGILALGPLGLSRKDVVHIKATKRNRAPDYVFRFPTMPPIFLTSALSQVIPNRVWLNAPIWWPVEAKATKTAHHKTPFDIAFIQLLTYWRQCANHPSTRGAVGFGLIFITGYDIVDPKVCIHLLVARRRTALTNELRQTSGIAATQQDAGFANWLKANDKQELTRFKEMFYGF